MQIHVVHAYEFFQRNRLRKIYPFTSPLISLIIFIKKTNRWKNVKKIGHIQINVVHA